MFKKKNLIILFLLTIFHVYGIAKRIHPVLLTTSIIVPCHVKHFPMLSELLYEYMNQTVIPDEIVVMVSAAGTMSYRAKQHLDNLRKMKWPFSLTILTAKEPYSAGKSRNIACNTAKGDILICQDADDLPHLRRVEIIKYFFENYDIDHLMHGFTESQDKSLLPLIDVGIDDIRYGSIPKYVLIHDIANGPAAINRKTFRLVQWTNDFMHAEDVDFNQKAYALGLKTVIIYEKLYLYRNGIKRDPI